MLARPVAAQTERVVIRPGDSLEVIVTDQASVSGKYQVPPDGAVTFPLIGRVQVEGKTAEQLVVDLRQRLTEFFRNPDVRLQLERPGRVFVMGNVTTPGSYELTDDMTVLEALTRAGYAGASQVIIVRSKDRTAPTQLDDPAADTMRVNLRELERDVQAGKLARNVVLVDGDTIYVPREDPNRIYVSGEVRNPGAFSVPDGTTVVQALALAGGVTERAAVGRVRVVRVIDGDEKSMRSHPGDNLKPGDTVVVPERVSFPPIEFGSVPSDASVKRPGEVRVGSTLSIRPAAVIRQIGIDTNVFNNNGETENDFTFVGGPQLDAILDVGHLRVKAVGTADFVYFRAFESERSINRSGSATADLLLARRIGAWVGGSIANTRDRLNVEVDGRARRFEHTFEAGVRVKPWRRLDIDLTGRDATREFDEGSTFLGIDLRQTLTERVRSASATARLALTPLTSLLFSGTASTHRFPLDPQKNADATEYSVGGLFKTGALVSGEARVGYLQYLSLDASAPDLRGLVGGVELFCDPTDRTRVGVKLERATGDTFRPQFPYALIDHAGGSLRQGLSRRFDVLFETYREKYEYKRFVAPGQTQDANSERTQQYAAEVGVRSGTVRVGFNLAYRQRLSTLPSRDYNGLRMTANASIFQVRSQ